MYLAEFKSRFAQLKECFPEKLSPCRKEQMYSLEQQCRLSLPASYKEFLLWGGIWAGGFLEGSDGFYDNELYKLRKSAEELLKEEDFPYSLPEDAFVFNMHQGYIFWFFKTSDGDDPPVYGYKQGGAPEPFASVPFQKIASSYSQFLLDVLESEAKLVKQWQE